jgi:phosphatidylserine/phosphatidylglycerophosphate/cardiolipin synthase-like enzyme
MRTILFTVLLLSPAMTLGQGIIINELYNSSSTGEWLELLILQDDLDLRGWSIRDFTSSGNPQSPVTFTGAALWSALPKGTVIVVGDGGFTGMTDTDPSDRVLTIKATDPLYFSGATIFQFAGTSDAVQLRNGAGTHVFGVSWGSANINSLAAPKVHFTLPGSLASGSAVAYLGGSLADITSTANWVAGTTSPTAAAGNSAANAAWINALRSSADGSGAAAVLPDTMSHGQSTTLAVFYRRDTAYTVSDLRVILPAVFSWPRTAGAVSLSGLTGSVAVNGDTITIAGISFGTDSAGITIQDVVAPDSTALYPVQVQSRAASGFRNVAPLPGIVVFGLPVTIAEVKGNTPGGIAVRSGQLVTVRGIVTVANQFGGPSFIQDNNAGIAIFGSGFSTAVQPGDEVIVSGTVDPFNGLTELTAPRLHSVVSSGNAVDPLPVTCADVANDGAAGIENYEAMLVRIAGVVLRNQSMGPLATWQMSGSGSNHRLLDATDTLDVRVDDLVDFANMPAPQGSFDITGVVGQFMSTLPYIGGYQLMPRAAADILAAGPGIATLPVESNITASGFTESWTTARPGTSALRFGRTPLYELGVLAPDTQLRTTHSIPLNGLEAATIYHVQVFSVSGTDTSRGSDHVVSTASPLQATGAMHVYFNKSVDPGLANGSPAAGNQDLVALLTQRMNGARRSIDAAFYNLSGTPGASLASAMVAAKQRGVRVRVICEQDNRSNAPFNALVSAGVPLISDTFDPVNAGAGLMHNKFVVIDGQGGAPESVWVWTGSWNPSLPGTQDDYQNAVEIQDPALAGAYTVEFNEMWGGTGDVPAAAVSRFGARKTDNTPHRFVVGGRPVLCYFSPSDRTTTQIITAISSADYSMAFSVLTLTRRDIANALLARKTSGTELRGVMDNRDDTGSQYDYLVLSGADVRLKTGAGLLHHKYGVIDAGFPSSHPTVITGSHNWTNSAEVSNGENTLIIEDATLAGHYLQEFAARYYQFGGADTIRVSVEGVRDELPAAFALLCNYPNPFNPTTTLTFRIPAAGRVVLKVYDLLGREVRTLVDDRLMPGTYRVQYDAGGSASGVYFARLEGGGKTLVQSMLLVR